MNTSPEKMKLLAPAVLRVGLAMVILWFGLQQIMNANMWTGLIPTWITSMSGISAVAWVYFNGMFEIIFGLCLLAGYFTKTTSFLLALHLLSIVFTVGYNDVGVRDFGLAMAVISIFLYGGDDWSLDKFLAKKQ